MRNIWGLLIFVLAIFIIAEARTHHWKRRTTTTTERGATEADSSEESSMDVSEPKEHSMSRTFSTADSDTTRPKKKISYKNHSHKSTTATSTTTEKNHKGSSHRSTESMHRKNITSPSLLVTPRPVNVTKNTTESPRVAHSTKEKSHTNSSTTTPRPEKLSTTHSRRTPMTLKKKTTSKKRHHSKTFTPPTKKSTKKSMNATVIATNSTTVIPSVSSNTTKSSRKLGHKSSSSLHKTTKTGVKKTKTPQSSKAKLTNDKIASTTETKNNNATTKSHSKTHNSTSSNIAASSESTTAVTSKSAETTRHSTNSKDTTTTKPKTNSTIPITTTVTKSKPKESNVKTIETTITRPVTTSSRATSNKTNASSSSTTAPVNSTIHRSTMPMKIGNHSINSPPHLTTAVHLPINSTNTLATTTGKTKVTTEKLLSTFKTAKNSTALEGTTSKITTLATTTSLGTAHPTNHDTSIQTQAKIKQEAPNFSYVVSNKETGIPCILSRMSISMTISYEKADHAIADGTVVVPKDASTDGICSDGLAVMKLTWSPLNRHRRELSNNSLNTIILNFINDGKLSSLDSMFFEFYLDKDNFPGAIEKILRGNTPKGLGLFMATVNDGQYICNAKTDINAGAIKVEITDVSLIMFNKDKNLNSKKEEKCTVKLGYKKFAVIGGAIGIVIAIGILGTCIWRRKIRPYDSSTLP